LATLQYGVTHHYLIAYTSHVSERSGS